MNTEKKLYTTEEAMKILGLKSKSGFFKKVKRHDIVPVKQWRYCFFTDEMVQDLKIDKQPGRPKTKQETVLEVKMTDEYKEKDKAETEEYEREMQKA